MHRIVIDNPEWESENPLGWGGPEYFEFDVYNPNSVERTRQWLTFCDPKRWFRFTVEVERRGNDLYIHYRAENSIEELNARGLGEDDFVWGVHILHNLTRGASQGSSTWNEGPGPGWKTIECERVGGGRRNRKPSTVWAIQREGSFRQQLLDLDGCCAISGEVCKEALEAAHIVPAYRGGREVLSNGILLRADIHRLYDSNPPKFEICPETGKVMPSRGFNYLSFDLGEREIDRSIRYRISEALRRREEESTDG